LRIPETGIGLMQLLWYKCAGAQWCSLDQVDLGLLDGYGVFIIWRNGDLAHASAVLYVGRGALRHEIARCRHDPLFNGQSGLRITWARVEAREMEGIAAYLYQYLRPIWGEVVSSLQPLPVNLPAA
jgi:hypothetical protein